jgi:thiamine-phosphate pyrophosphorylase
MIPDLTPAAERALRSAKRWAEQLAVAQVAPRHLLLALLDEEEGRVAVLLQSQALDLRRVREALAPGHAGPLAPMEPAPGNRTVEAALQPAVFAARQLALDVSGERTVASEHLFIAILQQEKELHRTLAELGFHLECVVTDLRGDSGPNLTLDEPLQLGEPVELIDTARILDANANRAREGLRVIEDFCRFSLDDAFLSGELKRLRHELAEALAEMSPTLLLEARETERDVGTRLTAPSEQARYSLTEVVQANFKRLEESLRALEEYGKLQNVKMTQVLESMRYRTYTLERAILLGTTSRKRLADARLYVLVGASMCTASVEWTIKEAAAGGAQIFQLREKNRSDRELLERARNVRRWTREAGVLFVMNDRPDIARLAEADGIHLGQEELSVKDARKIMGPDVLIGVSTHNLEQLRQAIVDGANYVGVGPTFASHTKEFEELAGLDFVRQSSQETTLPAYAIGGIGLENVDQVVAAGLRRIAVSSAICTADDPRMVAATLRRALEPPHGDL